MSIRTTVNLDEDVLLRLKEESKTRGVPLRKLLNDVLRHGLQAARTPSRKGVKIESAHMGTYPGLNYDNIGELIEYAEGPFWK